MGFFAVSAFILAACLVLLLVSFNREYFQYYLNRTDKKNEIEKDSKNINFPGENVSKFKSSDNLRSDQTRQNIVGLKNENNLNNFQNVENNSQVFKN